ncbi:MAG TPA: hypothetical protein VE990_14190, partial [Acidimicrobiales bacterium]|nr:hypothetical protein [Acidimicrobiales bacterium]
MIFGGAEPTVAAPPGLEWAGRSVAAAGADGGGDWFDLVSRPDGTVAVVVGDVMGHGDGVVALREQLSSLSRALVAEGHDATMV